MSQVYVERMGDEKLQRQQKPRKQRGKGGKEHQDCNGKRDLEKVGEEWRITARYKRNWRLTPIVENIVRKKSGRTSGRKT